MGKIVLVTGGVRSGKSSYALHRAEQENYSQHLFIATAEVCDEEMKKRVLNHQEERGDHWKTIEAGEMVAQKVSDLPHDVTVLIDCLTVWLGNVWYKRGDSDEILSNATDELEQSLADFKKNKNGIIYIVTNEVGWGIVPETSSVRQYRDWAGRVNQRVAAIADEVSLVVCGIAVPIKGSLLR